MIKRILIALMLACVPALAQDYTTVTGSNFTDGKGTPLSSGTLTFLGVDQQGNAISYKLGSGGQVSMKAWPCSIVSGAITGTCKTPNTATTNPSGICLKATVKDSGGQVILGGPGYACVQPTGSGPFVFDNFVPNTPPPSTILNNSISGNVAVNGNLSTTGNLTVGGTFTPPTLTVASAISGNYVASISNTSATANSPAVALLGEGGSNASLSAAIPGATLKVLNQWPQSLPSYGIGIVSTIQTPGGASFLGVCNSGTWCSANSAAFMAGGQGGIPTNYWDVSSMGQMAWNGGPHNTLSNLYGTDTAARLPAAINPNGPWLSAISSGNSTNNGGGIIFGSNTTQYGAALKYNLTNGTSNSQGHISFGTRHLAADSTLREVFTLQNGGITIGAQTGSAGGGIYHDGGGFKHVRVSACTTAATALASCNNTISWGTAFADNSYSVTCSILATSGHPAVGSLFSQTAASVGVQIFTYASDASTGTVECTAVHDED